jgi:hypothetical protein
MISKLLGTLCVTALAVSPLRAEDLLFATNYITTGLTTARAVVHDGVNTWVAVGDATNVVRVQFSGATYSTNKPALGTNASLNTIIYLGNNTYIAGGRPMSADGSTAINAPLIVVSTNGGLNWVVGNPPNFGIVPIQGLAFDAGNNRLVAVGALRKIAYANGAGPNFNWTDATLDEPSSFFESFTTVQSLGSGRFIAAGIAEGIRVSTNGGATWANGNQLVSLDNPNLNGLIADAGTLVAVGQLGRVLVSTNNGSSWNTGVASPVSQSLNSIVGLGNAQPNGVRFLAAGDNGRALTSTNGINWDTNYTSQTAATLRGGFFAASDGSDLVGTGAMLGDNNTLVIVGTRPPAVASVVNATTCAGTAGVLSVGKNPDANHPSNVLAVDWFSSAGTLVANNTTSVLVNDALPASPNQASNYVYYAVQRDLRTGFTNANATAVINTVYPQPTGVVSVDGSATNTIICQGSGTSIQVRLTGIGPWNVSWSDGVTQNNVGTNGPGPQIVTRSVNPTVTTVYTITNLTAQTACAASVGGLTGSATVTLDPIPPTVSCQNLTVNLDASGNVTITPAQLVAAAADNCSLAATNLSRTTFSCADVGTNLVTVTVTDSNGNTNFCVATVVVRDVTPPSLTCQNATVNLDGSGNVTITPAQLVAAASDNCSLAATNLSRTTFSCADIGTNLVTVTVTDSNGNTNFCVANVVVRDVTAPSLTCQNVTVNLDAGGNGSIAPAQLVAAASDNCGLAATNLSRTTFNCGDVGSNAVTVAVSDIHGNTNTCIATVTVVASTACDLKITRINSTNVMLEWYGKLTLLQSSNLSNWVPVSNGIPGGPHQLIWPLIPPPTNSFFRLTNAP